MSDDERVGRDAMLKNIHDAMSDLASRPPEGGWKDEARVDKEGLVHDYMIETRRGYFAAFGQRPVAKFKGEDRVAVLIDDHGGQIEVMFSRAALEMLLKNVPEAKEA